MKSKSLDFRHDSADKLQIKQNRNFNFVNMYKSVAESGAPLSENHKTSDSNDTESRRVTSESPKREKSPSKRKKRGKRETVDISQVTDEGSSHNNSIGGSTPLNESKVTSTPLGNCKHQDKSNKVKSIMKSSSTGTDDAMEVSNLDTSPSKPKKRNKSVSFMLEDNEEVVPKKTKSNDSNNTVRVKASKIKKQLKVNKDQHAEKENKINLNQAMDMENSAKERTNKRSKIKSEKPKPSDSSSVEPTESQSSQSENVNDCKKKKKKLKKFKKSDDDTPCKDTTESTSQEIPEKTKKPKKKKHQEKPQAEPDNDEPVSKSRKKDDKPDVVAELKNLSIGDNAHTITNLLDEMTVVDKNKRKKLKQKFNKNKKPKAEDSEKTEDSHDKVKWRRRKWNKDTKAEAKEGSLDTTVLIENLPLSMLFSYKKVLAEHFVKYGLIKTVGIAEVYPTEMPNPVFTTTINFYSDGAATQALEEDNTILEGSRIRVKRLLPATETTLVVRSYGTLTVQSLSTTFKGAGCIRNIRYLIKGKHAMATFFIEFDGPQSVERALKLGTNAKIGGKKIYLSKFEVRAKKSKQEKTNDNEGSDADQSEDSQD